MQRRFYEKLSNMRASAAKNSVSLSGTTYRKLLSDVLKAKRTAKKEPRDYWLLNRYNVMVIGNKSKLIYPVREGVNGIRFYVPDSELLDVLHEAQLAVGHGGRDRMLKELSPKYKNITRYDIELYLQICEPCQKKHKGAEKGSVVLPMVFSDFNSRCQVDLIDFRSHPDGEYKFIMAYQDHLTKFVVLKALKSKKAEVAHNLVDIFTLLGAPSILQSDNGREFAIKLQQQSRRNVRAYALSNDGEVPNAETAQSEQVAYLFNTHEESTPMTPPTMITLLVNGTRLSMEIDSGASSSIISEETFLRVLHGRPKLQRVSTVLRTWSNKTVPVLGSITVSAARDSRSAKLKLLVARGSGPSLLGRNWFAPLGISLVYHLLEKDRKGYIAKMKSDFAEIFQEGLGISSSSISLAHYDSNRPLAISCDASSIGIGAVLEHINADGTHESIYFASRVLQPSEQKCFVLGRKFTIFMDHKPLLGLLQQGKPIKGCVSPRMTRWSLILSSYDYELRYRPGKSIGAADALSRLPVKDDSACAEPMPPEVFMLDVEPHGPVSPKDIASATARDPILSKVRTWLMSGWPHKCPSADFAPFISKRDAFSLQRDCILFGSRVVIPSQLRQEMLRMLHRSHQGVVATKAIARSYMWWPSMASAIENMISHCSTCQSVRHLPPREPIHPWLDEEVDPWSRLHIDFAGPFRGRYLFVAMDSASKWPEAKVVSNISTSAAIRCLREIFATHGLPRILVSDNGPAFVSAPFRAFLRRCGVKHLYTPPYHPNSNGQAERTIQTLKQALRKLLSYNIDFDCCLANALFAIRTTPSRVTGRSPAESLMGRRLLSPFDTMLPHAARAEIARSPFAAQLRVFEVGDTVLARSGYEQLLPGAKGNSPLQETDTIAQEKKNETVLHDGRNQSHDEDMVTEEASISVICCVCLNETSGAYTCRNCGRKVHAICGHAIRDDRYEKMDGYEANILSNLCFNIDNAGKAKVESKLNLEIQAKRMKVDSNKQFLPARLGATVREFPFLTSTGDVADARNLLAVVMNVTENGFYRLGTAQGVLNQLYARSGFTPCRKELVRIEDVPNQEIRLRSAAIAQSTGSDQGFVRCTCENKCQTMRCSYVKKKIKCNSKCHSSIPCRNK
ncbi:hypothetical protein M513_05797 [Trichuris suis]|uniref:RNA-directed DNA polymerase n=1 Tax=Trichuris suis TaxID=68888 RepID=A0A085M7X0_9BILA|nr:hypothetical protein M513_05797 [Trichuris suis]